MQYCVPTHVHVCIWIIWVFVAVIQLRHSVNSNNFIVHCFCICTCVSSWWYSEYIIPDSRKLFNGTLFNIDWKSWYSYGFRGLVADFLPSHPGHHINPRRVNGSGVEPLFRQLKHTTGGNLTGYSYETAKATLLTKRSVHGRKSQDDYRNIPFTLDSQNWDGRSEWWCKWYKWYILCTIGCC